MSLKRLLFNQNVGLLNFEMDVCMVVLQLKKKQIYSKGKKTK